MRSQRLNVYGDRRLAQIGLVIEGYADPKGRAPELDEEMQRILDGLTKVNDDEKAADGVMVGALLDHCLPHRLLLPQISTSPSFRCIPPHHLWRRASY